MIGKKADRRERIGKKFLVPSSPSSTTLSSTFTTDEDLDLVGRRRNQWCVVVVDQFHGNDMEAAMDTRPGVRCGGGGDVAAGGGDRRYSRFCRRHNVKEVMDVPFSRYVGLAESFNQPEILDKRW